MDRTGIKDEIDRLVKAGTLLRGRELLAYASPEALKDAAKRFETNWEGASPETGQHAATAPSGGKSETNDDELDATLDKIFQKPDFESEYQEWYSAALRVVGQLIPDRFNEFRELYKVERRREMALENYGIADYVAGLYVTRRFDSEPEFNINVRAMTSFGQQIAIVKAARWRLESVVANIEASLHSEILDNELDAATGLLKASHIRSAGIVAAVVLEGHLKKLVSDHKVPFRKTAVLSNLNTALKEAGVYDVPQWRRIQYLTDIRNLCGHKAERDPERTEVQHLIDEVAKIIKTVF